MEITCDALVTETISAACAPGRGWSCARTFKFFMSIILTICACFLCKPYESPIRIFLRRLLFSDLAASCPHSISSERTLFGWLDSFNSSQPDTFLATKQERNSCRMLSGCSLVRYAGRSITSDTLLIDDRVGVPYCISK